MEAAICARAHKAWDAAWRKPRWAYSAGRNIIPLLPEASEAIEAGAAEVPLGDGVVGHVRGGTLAVDGNMHRLVRVHSLRPVDIVVAKDEASPHLDVRKFLTEMHLATNVAPERIHVHIAANGAVDVALAPSAAWVDPLIRRCFVDHACVQQFIGKYNIGGVSPQAMQRLFGVADYAQCPNGTPDALTPFVSPVRVVLDEHTVVGARYNHTVAELLDALPDQTVYLHGVPLYRCGIALWALSPVSHGTIALYTTPARGHETRTIMGGEVVLPAGYDGPAFVPSHLSFTGNAFAPPLRYLPDELAKIAPKVPTRLFMEQLTLGEPMTISRAQCIYRHMARHYPPEQLRAVLLSMALPCQSEAMGYFLDSQDDMPAHPTFTRYVAQVTCNLK